MTEMNVPDSLSLEVSKLSNYQLLQLLAQIVRQMNCVYAHLEAEKSEGELERMTITPHIVTFNASILGYHLKGQLPLHTPKPNSQLAFFLTPNLDAVWEPSRYAFSFPSSEATKEI